MPQVVIPQNAQQIEAVVAGPGTANRLFVCTGLAPCTVTASAGTTIVTVTFLVGPVLTQAQFHRATLTAAPSVLESASLVPGVQLLSQWGILSLDADWDDESGRVEVRAEIRVISQYPDTHAYLSGIHYQVTILAAM